MALRVALVTPFAWSQPHDVNEHVAGLARELRARGHHVTVLGAVEPRAATSARGGARSRAGSATRSSSRSARPCRSRAGAAIGVPVGVRANLAVALAAGGFDIVHGFEPGLPSLSYLALRDAAALTVATFFSPERLSLSARAHAPRAAARAARRAARDERGDGGGGRRALSRAVRARAAGVDLERFAPAREAEDRRARVAPGGAAAAAGARARARGAARLGARAPAHAAARSRPPVPRALRGRMRVRTALDGAARADILREAAVFVPAVDGVARVELEARAAGAAVASPPGARAPARARRRRGGAADRGRRLPRAAGASEGLAQARAQSFDALADRRRWRVYTDIAARRRAPAPRRAARGPGLDRRRPAHAHDVVARLLDRGRRPARPRGGGGARRDRRHRPQRLRRRARGGRARARPRADRHPRRGGEDRRPGRGDRPLPRARRSRAA